MSEEKNENLKKTSLLKIIIINALVSIGIFILGISFIIIPAVKGLPSGENGNEYFSFGKNEENIKLVNEESAVIEVFEKVDPSVVSIIVSKDLPVLEQGNYDPFEDFFNDPFFDNLRFKFFRPEAPQEPQEETKIKKEIGGGTGFIVSDDGIVVTNKHVIIDDQADYTVLLNNEEKYPAKVLAKDPLNDIAILKIDTGTEEKTFTSVQLGDSDNLKVGQKVISIGNALGEYRNTVSTGVVSGLRRNITAGDGNGHSEEIEEVIQTDAAINRGNSGGPLLNISGEVIGVNVAMAYGAENIAFSIPINSVKKTIEIVKEKGKLVRPIMGVRYIPVTKSLQEKNNLPVDYGALVMRGQDVEELAVLPGSPADKAGIVEYDILLEINGNKLDKDNPLSKEIMKYNVDDEITIKYLHKGEEREVTIKLAESID